MAKMATTMAIIFCIKCWLIIWSSMVLNASFGFHNFRPYLSVKPFRHLFSAKTEITIPPVKFASGTVKLPGSKSISNRVLLLASLASGNTCIENILCCEDVHVMMDALCKLGISVKFNEVSSQCRVVGNNGRFSNPTPVALKLDLKNAGTAMRPLTAALSLSRGKFILDGVQRMRERPILDLVDSLRQLGCDTSCIGGFPPVRIDAKVPIYLTVFVEGGEVTVKGNSSSQYLSALLMAAPLTKHGLTIHVDGCLVSSPYINITMEVMKSFGVEVTSVAGRDCRFIVPGNTSYRSPLTYQVEGDASSASYFLAAGAIAQGPVTVVGLSKHSIQGDVMFAHLLEKMGARLEWGEDSVTVSGSLTGHLKGIDVDCSKIPDVAMTLAVVALFAKGPTTLRNIGSWRLKECDRLSAMASELRKFKGVILELSMEPGCEFLKVIPPSEPITDSDTQVKVDTYNDHRMAMCFSLAACAGLEVVIDNPDCTSKTFPDFFQEVFKIFNFKH